MISKTAGSQVDMLQISKQPEVTDGQEPFPE